MNSPETRGQILGELAKAIQMQSQAEAVKELANKILADYESNDIDLRITRGPITGVVTAQVVDPLSRHRFLPGDILVSEAGVEVDGEVGWGMCFGNDRAGALAIAICDAEIARDRRFASEVRSLATECASARAKQRESDFENLRPTIVEFEEIS